MAKELASRGLAVVAAAWLVGCATLPSESAERALYVDLRKGTELGEDSGWVVDRLEVEEQMENALHSTCRVDRATRLRLETWLDGQVSLAGGPAAQQFRENGGDLSAVDDALELEHVRAVLREADAHAAEDCPFWLTPEPDFDGIQSDADRVVFFAESNGFGAVVFQGSETALGGGGSGRLLVGHGFGPTVTLALGGEIGGTGAFVDSENESTRSLETRFFAAFPVRLRLTRFSRILDLEVAPVVRITDEDDLLPPGMASSIGVGLATMRSTVWMPYFVLFVGHAYHPPHGGEPAEHSARIGTRVGIDIDP